MIKADYLKHGDALKDPAQKDNINRSHLKYRKITGTFHDLIMDNVNGHQVVPGEYEWCKDIDGKSVIRKKTCWRSGNIIIVEFDEDIPYHTLQDVVEDDDFIRENAFALTHSVSSYYKHNKLRYRVWFGLTYNGGTSYAEHDVKYKLESWEFAKDQILKRYNDSQSRFPVADRSGSILTSGAYGIKDAKHIILGNEVTLAYRKEWGQAFREWQENRDSRQYEPVDADSFDELPDGMIQDINGMSFKTDGWSTTYLPCMFGGNHDDDEHDPKMAVCRAHNRYTFYCFKCPQSKTYRRKLTRKDIIRKIRNDKMPHLSLYRPPSKLVIQKQDLIYSTIDENRAAIYEFLMSDSRVLGIALETGGGKTEAALKYADETSICLVLPTHKLANDIEKRVKVMHHDDYRIWRSRFHDYTKDEADMEIAEGDLPPDNFFLSIERKCVTPTKCKNYRDKGGDVVKTICINCPVYEDCKTEGYLAQFDTFSHFKVQIITMKDLFTNPQHTTFAKKVIGDSQRVAFVDEAKAHDFYNESQVNKKTLRDLSKIWRGKELGEICDYMLEHWDNEAQWDTIINVSEEYYAEIMYQLSTVRCFIKGTKAIDDSEFTERMFYLEIHGLFDIDTVLKTFAFMPKNDAAFEHMSEIGDPVLFVSDSGIKNELTLTIDQCVKLNLINLEKWSTIPRVFDREINWYSELGRSIEHYGKFIKMEGSTDDVIKYSTPPIIFDKLDKFVAMSATLDKTHFLKVFSEYKTQFLTRPPTEFNTDARLYQLRTGTMPVGEWIEDQEFAKSSLFKLEIIEHKMESEPENKYGIISSQNIVNLRKDVWADMEPYIEFTHFGNTEGLNELFKDIDTFIIIGSFQLPPNTIKDRSMLIFGDEPEALSFDRYKDPLNNSYYNDGRVQSVHDQAVLGELIQDIGRGRLNLFPKRVLLFSSYNIPTYSSRALLFDMADLEVAETFSDLETVINTRQKEESETNDKVNIAVNLYHQGKNTSDVINATGLTYHKLKEVRKYYNIVVDNPTQKQIRTFLIDKDSATLAEIRENTDISARNIQYHLNKMIKDGILYKVSHGTYKYRR